MRKTRKAPAPVVSNDAVEEAQAASLLEEAMPSLRPAAAPSPPAPSTPSELAACVKTEDAEESNAKAKAAEEKQAVGSRDSVRVAERPLSPLCYVALWVPWATAIVLVPFVLSRLFFAFERGSLFFAFERGSLFFAFERGSLFFAFERGSYCKCKSYLELFVRCVLDF